MKKIYLSLLFLVYIFYAKAQWQQMSLDSGGVDCMAINDTNFYAGAYGDGFYLSTNEGATWTIKNEGLTDLNIMCMLVNGIDIYVGTDHKLFVSTNNGANWAPSTLNWTSCVSSLTKSGITLFAAALGGGIYRSTNDGLSWIVSNSGLFNDEVWSVIGEGANIYAGTDAGVFLSTNYGVNWAIKDNGLPSIKSTFSMFISGTRVFAGTGFGIYYTNDNGSNWIKANTSIPVRSVFSFTKSGTVLYAGGYSAGVFRSTDNGENWVDVNTGLPGLGIYSLIVNGTYLFAGINNYGIWKRSLVEMIISEVDDKDKIFIYPNPAREEIVIAIEGKYSNINKLITIFNIEGQAIQEVLLKEDKNKVDISALAAGIYFIRLYVDNKIEIKKFVKE